jgi:hypothetical protein
MDSAAKLRSMDTWRDPHSAKATWNAHLNYLFIEPGATALPEKCCTLAISPLIKELVDRLTREGIEYPPDSHAPG